MTFAINTIASANETLTMSSREIAELTGKRHDNVKRTIETLVERGVIDQPQIEDGLKSANQVVTKEYRLAKRDTYVLVAQLSPEFTAALVDRWQALEAATKPALPTTYLEALRAHLASEEKVAVLALENAKKDEVIAEQAPKAEFYDELVDTAEVYTPTQVANLLGNAKYKSAQKVNELLCELGWQYKRGRHWFASAVGVAKGYMQSKVFTNDDTGFSGTHVRITVEGLNAMRKSVSL